MNFSKPIPLGVTSLFCTLRHTTVSGPSERHGDGSVWYRRSEFVEEAEDLYAAADVFVGRGGRAPSMRLQQQVRRRFLFRGRGRQKIIKWRTSDGYLIRRSRSRSR